MTGERPLIDQVREWIKKQGQHLEFRVADQFARAGFTVLQGVHAPSDAGKCREVDVLAIESSMVGPIEIRFEAVVECKYSKDCPWIALSNTNVTLSDETIVSALPGNAQWERAVPLVLGSAPELLDGPILRRTPRHAFGARQGLAKNRNDVVYEALRGVVSKTREGLREMVPGEDEALLEVALPIVVVEGGLFEAFWSRDDQGVVVEQRRSARLYWTGDQPHGSVRPRSTAVDLVCADAVDDYLKELRDGLGPLLASLEQLAPRIVLGLDSESA